MTALSITTRHLDQVIIGIGIGTLITVGVLYNRLVVLLHTMFDMLNELDIERQRLKALREEQEA